MAAQAGLSLPWSQTPKTGFSRDEAQLNPTVLGFVWYLPLPSVVKLYIFEFHSHSLILLAVKDIMTVCSFRIILRISRGIEVAFSPIDITLYVVRALRVLYEYSICFKNT